MTFRRRAVDSVAAPDIHISHIDLNFGSKFLLTDAELHLSRSRCAPSRFARLYRLTFLRSRYGLVGRNGAGKTTLMRAISAREIDVPKSVRVLHVEQEATGDDTLVLDCVLLADVERTELLAQEKQETSKGALACVRVCVAHAPGRAFRGGQLGAAATHLRALAGD